MGGVAESSNENVRAHLRQCVHDLNNVLGQVLGFGSLLVRDVGEASAKGQVPKALLTYAEELLAAGLRGEAIAKELAAVVRSLSDANGPKTATSAPGTAGTATAGAALPDRKGRVMLVGATDLAGSTMAKALRDARWSIEAYRSGATALRTFRANEDSFDALVTHQGIPEIRGTELITAVKALKGSVACILFLDDPKTDQTSAQLAGANACLTLGTPDAELVTIVEKMVERLRPAS
jgi:CheY-like chemotaxis protein